MFDKLKMIFRKMLADEELFELVAKSNRAMYDAHEKEKFAHDDIIRIICAQPAILSNSKSKESN